jgi:hypothetical protein
VVAGVLVAVGAGVWSVTSGGGTDVRAGSELVDADPDGLLTAEEPPGAYRIDYRIEGYGGGDVVATSDRLWVRRPFESRLEVYGAAEPDGEPDAVQVAAFARFRADGAGRSTVVVAAPPGPPASDVRVSASLAEALEDGRAELVEHRRVLGRTCHVIRTALPLATGDLTPAADEDERADTCIDAHGLVLEELVVSDGEPLLRRIAVDVELDPDLGDVSFEGGEPNLELDEGGGFVGEVEPGGRTPGRFFEPATPQGFRREGRYAVVPPQTENFTDPTRHGQRLTYVSDVFVDGVDVLVLDQGGTFGDVEPFPDLDGSAVDVALGPAVLTHGQLGPAVVVELGEGDFLRARGTVAPARLIDLLRSLEEVEGGELRLVDPDGDPPQRGGG